MVIYGERHNNRTFLPQDTHTHTEWEDKLVITATIRM